jgi:hypothetical protein
MLRFTEDQLSQREQKMLDRSKDIGRAKFKLKVFIPLETAIQSSIVEAITKLNLGTVNRINSGAMEIDGRYVQFNSAAGHSDLTGALRPHGRAYFLEVKRPGWNGPATARELRQSAFLDRQRAAGAIAAFVTSVDEALAVLKG